MKKFGLQLVKFWREKINSPVSSLLSVMWIGGLVVASLSLWAFIEIADEVLEQETESLDFTVLKSLQSLHNPLLDRLTIAITYLGDPFWLTCFCLILAAVLFWQKQKNAAATLTIVVIGGVGLNFLLKDLFSRDRPMLEERLLDVDFYSFPSGHAMISIIVYGFLGYLLITRYRRWQSLILSSSVILILLIGFSRLYLGVHWFTDVLAGYAAGLVWLLVCILSLEIIRAYFIRRLATQSAKD